MSGRAAEVGRFSQQEVVDFYDTKTDAILARYGPGPRVHYHTGFPALGARPSSDPAELKRQIWTAQENVLAQLGVNLRGRSRLEVLDVGCGLGGGSLYWAAVHGAAVDGITIAPSHLPHVRRFAEEARVADRVRARLCDAMQVEGHERYDVVVAIESACYLPRPAWMKRVRELLRPGGLLLLADCFIVEDDYFEPFNRYWRTNVGSRADYLGAAEGAELTLVEQVFVTESAASFWTLTSRLIELEAARTGADPAKTQRSIREHTRLGQGLMDGGMEYATLAFARL